MGTWQIAANHVVGGVADGDRGMEKRWQSLLKTTVEGLHLSQIITKYLAAVITVIMDDAVQSVSPLSSLYYQKKLHMLQMSFTKFPKFTHFTQSFQFVIVKS